MGVSVAVPTGTLLTIGGVLGGLAVVAYILKMRRRRFEVPFSTLWQRVLREKESTSLWRHLRRLLSLLLMLAILGLLLFAARDPKLGSADKDAKHVVIIIDASASMKTLDESRDSAAPTAKKKKTDGDEPARKGTELSLDVSKVTGPKFEKDETWRLKNQLDAITNSGEYNDEQRRKAELMARVLDDPKVKDAARMVIQAELDEGAQGAGELLDSVAIKASSKSRADVVNSGGGLSRIEIAKKRARKLLSSMGGGDRAMIMKMDGQSTPLSRFTSDMAMLRKVVDNVHASDTPADLRRALSAAADALRTRQAKNKIIIIIGDGGYREQTLNAVVWDDKKKVAAAQPGKPAAPPKSAEELEAEDMDIDFGTINLKGVKVRYIPVGQRDDNVGIVSFNVRRYLHNKLSYEAYIEVQNFGSSVATRKLWIYAGNSPISTDPVELVMQPGERMRKIYTNLSGGDDHRLRAELRPVLDKDIALERKKRGEKEIKTDIFPLDDVAYALLPKRTKLSVLLVTTDNLYLEGAALVYDNIKPDKLTPEQYEAAMKAGTLEKYQAIFFDDYTPEQLPPEETHVLYFSPKGKNSPFEIRGYLKRPRVTRVNDSHPVMRWLTMSDINFDQSAVFKLDRRKGEVGLAYSIRSPIIAAKKEGRRKVVGVGFSLRGTDMMLRVAFPLFLVNVLDWFSGDDTDLITTYNTGRRNRVPMDGTFGLSQVEVVTPNGVVTRAPLSDGTATFYGHTVGVHRLTAVDKGEVVAKIELAANLANPAESNIAPIADLYLGGQKLERPGEFSFTTRQSIWLYLVLLVVVLLCVEWYTYNRRVTV
jgi:hypothetical protein